MRLNFKLLKTFMSKQEAEHYWPTSFNLPISTNTVFDSSEVSESAEKTLYRGRTVGLGRAVSTLVNVWNEEPSRQIRQQREHRLTRKNCSWQPLAAVQEVQEVATHLQTQRRTSWQLWWQLLTMTKLFRKDVRLHLHKHQNRKGTSSQVFIIMETKLKR